MPQALAVGVDYGIFWDLNPRKLEPFMKAFQQKMRFQQEQTNFASWLSGMYVTHAIATCFGKDHKYPSNPISLNGGDEEDQIRKKATQFEAFAINYNQQYKKNMSQNQ